ncbi:hypothetical protein MMC32_002475 [Xylographa parallela]|nr:hypothetical protein [Xylographa parallela]
MASEKIDALQNQILALSKEVAGDEENRTKLLGVAMMAVAVVETPLETIWRLIMSPHAPAALMTCIKMGLVNAIVDAKAPQTAEQLAKTTGADKLLIVRLMRPLLCLGVFEETGVQTYASTPISQLLTTPPLFGGYQFMFSAATASLAKMPNYLASTGFKHVNGAPGPFQYAHKDNPAAAHGFFPWIISDPAMLTNFNNFMSGQRMNRKDWYDFFPVDNILFNGASKDPESPLLLDIAGGEGHDTEAFRKRFPKQPGKVFLMDLPETIDNIKHLDPEVVRVKYNFFEPQPIKNARAYYFRSIFHDWPDSECIKILKNTASAMTPGYSKLLIFEWILPAKGVPMYPSLLDMNMMTLLNGMERTEEQWIALLGAAGFKVDKFWILKTDTEGLIEASLK